MALLFDRTLSGDAGPTLARPAAGRSAGPAAASRCVEIGLVNNMPDAALRATERQFVDLIGAAAGAANVRLRFTTLDGIARGPAARDHLAARYEPLGEVLRQGLDALIVTGCEPRADRLPQEPYWDELARLIDWAERNTLAAIWSCLAAHAAVLHLDGIERRRLPEKRFGLFECVRAAEHPILEGTSAGLRVPHSRWNDLREGDLKAHGYQVLTRSLEAGVDTFAKRWGSDFLFFQGHPEYEPDTLFREYRRDLGRFARGERPDPPRLPTGYLEPATERSLEAATALRQGAALPEGDPSVRFRTALIDSGRRAARTVYGNWIRGLAARKA